MTGDGNDEQLCFPMVGALGSGREGPFAPHGLRKMGECPATGCVPARSEGPGGDAGWSWGRHF